jgi:hypothetical protein
MAATNVENGVHVWRHATYHIIGTANTLSTNSCAECACSRLCYDNRAGTCRCRIFVHFKIRAEELRIASGQISAWRGERERSLASFQAALVAGVADPHDRLANFVVLEKRALALGVELDIQKLLEVVGLNAIRDKKEAARQLARLVKDYTEYLGVPLGPIGTTDGPHADAKSSD